MSLREQMTEAVALAATRAGFELAGVAPVRPEDYPESQVFAEWIAAGHAGEMSYMEKRTDDGRLRRASAKNSAPWARSVVICALNYNTAQPYSTEVHDSSRGWISRYAWGAADYHDALLPRLRQVEAALKNFAGERSLTIETRSYVDTGPLLERMYAKYAGIGWSGKNTCIINQQKGSWLFLGAILTSIDIEEGTRSAPLPPPDRCGSCTRCIDACPTQAIVAPGNLDARRCIAYLIIEKRGDIPTELRDAMGTHVFGCDICQDVCPWNKPKPNQAANRSTTAAPEFQPRQGLYNPELKWLASLDEAGFREVFRGSPLKRAKYSGLKRNIAVAMGNSGNRNFIPDLERLAVDPDPVVASHAQWALQKLSAAVASQPSQSFP